MHSRIILLTGISGLATYKSASRKWENLCKANLTEPRKKGGGEQGWPKMEVCGQLFQKYGAEEVPMRILYVSINYSWILTVFAAQLSFNNLSYLKLLKISI